MLWKQESLVSYLQPLQLQLAALLAMSLPKNTRKAVTFAEGTVFEASRPQALFHRIDSHYTPGRHGRAADDAWEDTSFVNSLVYQLDHHKVLQTFVAVDLQHAQALKSAFRDHMMYQTCMDYIFEGDKPTVKYYPAPDYLMAELEKTLIAQQTDGVQSFVHSIGHADGLVLWKEKGTGECLGVQWITDTYNNREACDLSENMKLAIPCENKGYKRSLVLSQLRRSI
jgi:hypothetical protein